MKRLGAKRLFLFSSLLLIIVSTGTYAVDSDSGGGNVTVNVGETVVMTVSAPQNFTAITEADISAGTLVNTGAFTITVDAITNFTVDAQLTTTATTSLTAAVPAGESLLLAASASGKPGTSAVSATAFGNTLPATINLDAAFSNQNNADGTGESSTIDLTLDMDKLGDREQAETLTYTLSFIVTEQ